MNFHNSRTLEDIHKSAVAGFYARLKSNYEFLYERFGDIGIELIAEMSRRYGLEVAERAKKRLQGNDAISVASYLMRIFETMGRKGRMGKIAEMSDTRVVMKADECPMHLERTDICLAHTTMEKTMVETLNPQLTYRIGTSIPAGDSYCEHIIEKKEI